MLIIYNKLTAGFCLPPNNNAKNVDERNGKILLPGENSVTKETWEKFQDNPGVRIQVGRGNLVNYGEGQAVPLSQRWDDLSSDKVESMLEGMNDIDAIEKVKANTDSKVVKDLCDERLDVLAEENRKAAKPKSKRGRKPKTVETEVETKTEE
jgi:hypothetical protein